MSVRHALLALLSEGPKYGLQLREEFEARTGEIWPQAGIDYASEIRELGEEDLEGRDRWPTVRCAGSRNA